MTGGHDCVINDPTYTWIFLYRRHLFNQDYNTARGHKGCLLTENIEGLNSTVQDV